MYFKSQVHEWKNKKVSSICYYNMLNESKTKKMLKNQFFLRHFLSTIKSLKLLFKNAFFWDTF